MVLDKEWPKGAELASVVDELPETECRYVFFDFNTTTDDKRKIAKTLMIIWNPNCSPIKEKFAYSSSKQYILSVFQGVQVEILADNKQDVGLLARLGFSNHQSPQVLQAINSLTVNLYI